MPIKRQTITDIRRVVNKFDYHPTRETIRMLCDGALELLDLVEGGPGVQQQRAELAERERQVGLALTDLQNWADEAWVLANREGNPFVMRGAAKVRYGIDLVRTMLKAKGPKWKREWSWYLPRIEEEFGSGNQVAAHD